MSKRIHGAGRWIVLFLIILIVWSFYRYIFQFPEWVDEFIAKPLLQLLPVLVMVTHIERVSYRTLGLNTKRVWLQIVIGLAVGLFLIGESIYLKKMRFGVLSLQTNNYLPPLLVSAATGFIEEVVYRGYFLSRIIQNIKNIYIANVVQTVFFVLIHVPLMIFLFHYSPHDMFFYSLQIFVLGYVFGVMFLQTNSIIPSAVAHAMWNLANVLVK